MKHLLFLALFCAIAWGVYSQSPVSAETDPLTFEAADPFVCDPTANRQRNELQNIHWVFEETFDGDPDSPSQALLPDTFDYAATHRIHPSVLFDPITTTFPADHSLTCDGPNPNVSPLPQHQVASSNNSNGTTIDPSFYICKNHMMSSMGEISPYSLTSFWPRQEFKFANGGVLEFEVNPTDEHGRFWWEVLIMPRDQLKINSARHFFPIDEIYPRDFIVFDYHEGRRRVQVGKDSAEWEEFSTGMIVDERRPLSWAEENPNDPANTDRRIRRIMRMTFNNNRITWEIERENGTFSAEHWRVPGGLPFEQGIIVFKTHAYTPTKADNFDNYTFHWDNIRFSGPWAGEYTSYEAQESVYLEANGNRPIGDTQTVTIDLPEDIYAPALFGQLHNPIKGQVLLSINGGEPISVEPHDYIDGDNGETNCYSDDWKAFHLPLRRSDLVEGENTFTWTVGPRPECAQPDWPWNGFSVKDFEVQLDRPPVFVPAVFK